MSDKPVIVDYETKLCSGILQPLFNMVWDGLGEVADPVGVRTFVGAQPASPSDGVQYVAFNGGWTELPSGVGTPHNDLSERDVADCHPQAAIVGLEAALGGKVESLVAGTNITVDATDPLNPIVSSAGVSDHPSLTGRSTADSHPQSAITGLVTALGSKVESVVAGSGVTVDSSDPANPVVSATAGSGLGRNLLINGNFRVAQRGHRLTSDVPQVGYVAADRWASYVSSDIYPNIGAAGSEAYTGTLSKTGGGSGVCVAWSTHSVQAGTYYLVSQHVEGNNIAQLLWGGANAKTITVSFIALADLAGTYFLSVRNRSGATPDRSYVHPFTLPGGRVPTVASVTIPGATTGTWNTDDTIGLSLGFGASVGSSYWAPSANSWVTGDYVGRSGGVNLGAVAGSVLAVSDVQVEVGNTATDYEVRSFGDELALCQRYLETSYSYGTAFGTATTVGDVFKLNITGPEFYDSDVRFAVAKRAAPAIVVWSSLDGAQNALHNISTETNTSGAGVSNISTGAFRVSCSSAGMTPANSIYGFQYAADAEL